MYFDTLKPQQKIERVHVALMNHPSTVAFSGIVMMGKTTLDNAISTAATDGCNVAYNPDFVNSLTEQELTGLVLHEKLHVTYGHFWLWQDLFKKDAPRANMACDYVINAEIKALEHKHPEFIKLPSMGLYDPRYNGMDSMQVFNALQGQATQNSLDQHQWEQAQQHDQQALQQAIDSAIRQGAMLAGKLAGDVNRSLSKLMTPKVNWREQLRDFISNVIAGKDESTWRKPNRRWLAQDVYMPSQISESVGRLVIAVDTSGSIDDAMLTTCMSELVGICETTTPDAIDLIYWDHKVSAHEYYDPTNYHQIPHVTKPKGGGGTNPQCVATYIQQQNINPAAVIVLTDGYVDGWGTWSPPVLWCIIGNNAMMPTCGSVVRVPI